MAVSGGNNHRNAHSKMKLFGLCSFWQSGNGSSSASSVQNVRQGSQSNQRLEGADHKSSSSHTTVSSVARSLFPPRRRLQLDPPKYLYFPNEPGIQVRSAVRLKNKSKSHVAFKFQTTAPKSCYMRPPGGVLAPGQSLIATVFKFMEQPESNEKQLDHRNKAKFKIVSLKVKAGVDYIPELFDEQKHQVTVERVLRAFLLDPQRPSHNLEKLKQMLAEADAALEARKKPPADGGPPVVGEGLVIDEWKERREKYLAQQQVEAVDPI